MSKLVPGMKVRYLPQPEWGVGHLVALLDADTKAQVLFPAREGDAVQVSTKGGALVPQPLLPGDAVRNAKGREGRITGEEEGGRGLRRYTLRYQDGEEDELPESELRAEPPKPDLLSSLKEGRVGEARAFELRKQALVLDDERRNDALGALFASRVMVKPHQVGVVQRVLCARRPRFILADEVGLGKTIEAGMVFSALRLAGLARRVLVVAPSHLTVQWLGELFHKFNQLFTLMDAERYQQALEEAPDVPVWARFELVVTSLEFLSRSSEHLAQASRPEAGWDLVIFDEAHHLKSERAFQVARALSGNTWGLLLLTATPMQLDPAEYHGLLTLVDPDSAPTLEGFVERLSRQEALSEAVRALLAPSREPRALAALAARFPDDTKLQRLLLGPDAPAALAHLAETYSLSERLLRNRRAVVGGFSERRLHRHLVTPSAAELEAREQVRALLRERGALSGAPLAQLFRRLESSPAAFVEAVRGTKSLAALEPEVRSLAGRDAKFHVFLQALKEVWSHEPSAKVLVFTESRATLDWLSAELGRERIEALGYHGDLPLLERDRQVARFRDPDGPKVLLCTEVGGEGRNFQFAHHLFHYDLPWSPATVEQRIGRLDRIGQIHPVELHVFEPQGTLSQDVLGLLADAVGVFGETVGGLDAVLEEVEGRLVELAQKSPEERAAYRRELTQKVAQARAQVKRAYDPLLDIRSFDRAQVEELVQKARVRLGMDDEQAGGLEEGLWSIARDLDERLEETVTELARRVGIGVDTDEQVEAFECAFHFGHALKVEALPGVDISLERTQLGTFWRDTAVEREEVEYFATGHPLVEGLFGFLRDGPYGRTGFRHLEPRAKVKGRGLEFLFHLVPSEPADTSPGAKVPSRQLARFIERWLIPVVVAEGPSGQPRLAPELLPHLTGEGRSLRGDEVRAAFPHFAPFVDAAVTLAQTEAQAEANRRLEAARERLVAEQDSSLERLRLALTHQGLPPARIEAQLSLERAHTNALLEALAGVKVSLDCAAGFVLHRP